MPVRISVGAMSQYNNKTHTGIWPSFRAIAFLLALAPMALAAAGCAQNAPLPPPGFAQERMGSLGRDYKLGYGDKLKLTVFGEPELSGEFEVDASGRIAMPLIGPVDAVGLTIEQFTRGATARLGDGFLKNPRLNVEVINYRPIYVHGEVRSGGEFKFKNGLRVRDAVAMAGGYTYRADQGFVLLARDNQPAVRVALPSNISLLPGDNLRIPERFF